MENCRYRGGSTGDDLLDLVIPGDKKPFLSNATIKTHAFSIALWLLVFSSWIFFGGSGRVASDNCDHGTVFQSGKVNDLIDLVHPKTCQVGEGAKHFDDVYNHRGESDHWAMKFNASMDRFYNDAKWPPILLESFSGGGSNRGFQTEVSMAILKRVISEHNITTMIDVPCGDANWIFDSLETDSMPLYVGLDIVGSLIEFNQKRFAFHSNKRFYWWDGINCAFPKQTLHNDVLQPFELIHSRDVIQHLPLKDGLRFVCNVFLSGARWFVTTTHKFGSNRDIQKHGKYYANNLHAAPFNLPDVGKCEATHPKLEADVTCVFDLSADWAAKYRIENCNNMTYV
jgi:hypothetical protein